MRLMEKMSVECRAPKVGRAAWATFNGKDECGKDESGKDESGKDE